MRIGFLTQWYEPEPGPAATTSHLARSLAARGHDVHVLTGFPNYPSGRIADGYRQRIRTTETLGGVNVVRVPVYPSHDGSSVRRLINYTSFAASASLIGVPSLPKLDALWVNYSPITIALPMWLEALTRRTPLVCEVADLWPDTLQVAGMAGAGRALAVARSGLDAWCRTMYKTSRGVVHISPGVRPLLVERGVPPERIHYIPKSADESVHHPGGRSLRNELAIEPEATVVLYAGSMGGAQGLETLIDAAAVVADPKLVVLMAGSGNHESVLRARTSALGLDNVRFLGRRPQHEMTNLMATADFGYVSLAANAVSGVTMPSKTQAILASGRPLIVAADGDVADLAERHGVGFVARSGEAVELASVIRRAMGSRDELPAMAQRARALYEEEFSLGSTTSAAEALLRAVSRGGGT